MKRAAAGFAFIGFVLLCCFTAAVAAPIDCRYAARDGKSPEPASQGACGTLSGDELQVSRGHLEKMLFLNGLASVLIGNQAFYVNEAGKAVRVLLFDNGPDYFAEGLARAVAKGKIGFVDRKLRVVIKPVYDFAFPFESSRAMVCNGCSAVPQGEHVSIEGGYWGAIDKTGKVLVPLELTREALLKELGGKQERGK